MDKVLNNLNDNFVYGLILFIPSFFIAGTAFLFSKWIFLLNQIF